MDDDLVTIREKEISKEGIRITPKCFLWCKLPYRDHKYGCPNYGRDHCPPHRELFDPDPYVKFRLVYAEFDFKTYKERMRKKHPDWSERQVANLLYWQGSVKKMLKNRIKTLDKNGLYLLGCGSGFSMKFQRDVPSMEAVGIYVYGLLKQNDIPFEIKPRDKVVLVCLLCYKKVKTIFDYM